MKLGMFMMPVHHPDKPWAQALAEDRQTVIEADRLGFAEVWVGEHFASKTELIPAPLMFLASVMDAAPNVRFGTGVIGLAHHHPILVASETAQFDQLTGGRLLLGVGPGGLMADGEIFGHPDMGERYAMAMESLDIILALWQRDAPLKIEGKYWNLSLQEQVWRHGGVGMMPRPLQRPHPPIAMAMVGPGGRTAEIIAERDFIPISANFVPIDIAEQQWIAYAAARDKLGRPADPAIWRLCRNVLVAGSEAEARDALADPTGTMAFYFQYLRGLRRLPEVKALGEGVSARDLNAFLNLEQAYEECVIAGTSAQVLERLVGLVDRMGPFGHLVTVGHDWDGSNLWLSSMRRLATEVMPKLSQHADAVRKPKAS